VIHDWGAGTFGNCCCKNYSPILVGIVVVAAAGYYSYSL